MGIAQIAVTGGGIALIGCTLWFFFGAERQNEKREPAGEYACPMHRWITSSDPGAVCSVCGMKLQRSQEEKADVAPRV